MNAVGTCGHHVDNFVKLYFVSYKAKETDAYSGEDVNVVKTGFVCKRCFDEVTRLGFVLDTVEDERRWVDGK